MSEQAVRVEVPVRIADVGGWTDTWFAQRGAVCHLGVGPGVRVGALRRERRASDAGPVQIVAPDIQADYFIGPDQLVGSTSPTSTRHSLLDHAIAHALEQTSLDPAATIEVTITAAVPPGASLGTSASVVIGILAALHALFQNDAWTDETRAELATSAHEVETQRAGREAGVQDQWAAAFGGAQLLEITSFPHVARHPLAVAGDLRERLNHQVLTVVFAPHDSSDVHRQVIRTFTNDESKIRPLLDHLADLAHASAHALEAGDFFAWAEVLTQATIAQANLHPGLVGNAHREAIAIAREHNAAGWKVNGAGGSGGSLTIACASMNDAARLRATLKENHPDWIVPTLQLAPSHAPLDSDWCR